MSLVLVVTISIMHFNYNYIIFYMARLILFLCEGLERIARATDAVDQTKARRREWHSFYLFFYIYICIFQTYSSVRCYTDKRSVRVTKIAAPILRINKIRRIHYIRFRGPREFNEVSLRFSFKAMSGTPYVSCHLKAPSRIKRSTQIKPTLSLQNIHVSGDSAWK